MPGAGDRDLALFAWDCIRPDVTQPCAVVMHPGLLAASARYNYDPDLGTIAVTRTNQHDPATGRLVRRDHAVGNGVVEGITRFTGEAFFFTQNHNDVGLLDTLTYPCRSSGCGGNDPGRTIQHAYANGQLQSAGTWASNITYRPNGMIDTITRGTGSNATLETWAADPHGMARPRSIDGTNAAGVNDRFDLTPFGSFEFDPSRTSETTSGGRSPVLVHLGENKERSAVVHEETSLAPRARRFSLSR